MKNLLFDFILIYTETIFFSVVSFCFPTSLFRLKDYNIMKSHSAMEDWNCLVFMYCSNDDCKLDFYWIELHWFSIVRNAFVCNTFGYLSIKLHRGWWWWWYNIAFCSIKCGRVAHLLSFKRNAKLVWSRAIRLLLKLNYGERSIVVKCSIQRERKWKSTYTRTRFSALIMFNM